MLTHASTGAYTRVCTSICVHFPPLWLSLSVSVMHVCVHIIVSWYVADSHHHHHSTYVTSSPLYICHIITSASEERRKLLAPMPLASASFWGLVEMAVTVAPIACDREVVNNHLPSINYVPLGIIHKKKMPLIIMYHLGSSAVAIIVFLRYVY